MNKFRVMDWLRKVRDKNYDETKALSGKEILETYRAKAEEARSKAKSCKVAR